MPKFPDVCSKYYCEIEVVFHWVISAENILCVVDERSSFA